MSWHGMAWHAGGGGGDSPSLLPRYVMEPYDLFCEVSHVLLVAWLHNMALQSPAKNMLDVLLVRSIVTWERNGFIHLKYPLECLPLTFVTSEQRDSCDRCDRRDTCDISELEMIIDNNRREC